jgi:hypothetical protein
MVWPLFLVRSECVLRVVVVGRPLIVGLFNQALLAGLRNHRLIGLDAKHDFVIYHFPVILVSFPDRCNQGTIAAIFVVSAENADTVSTALQLVQYNVPCTRRDCNHETEYRQRLDGEGL